MIGIDVDITIRSNATSEYLRIPVIPSEIPYTDGDALADSVKILNLGNIDFPNGVDLDSLSLTSFFPARYDPYLCGVSSILTPVEYRNIISGWKDAGTSLQVIIPAAGINKSMYVANFQWTLKGAEGDLYYTLNLKEYKVVRPKQLTPGGKAPAPGKKLAVDRIPVASKQKPSTYTVRAGDTLTLIGKKLGVSWDTLYTKNKAVIGPSPSKIKVGAVYRL
ncbi:MAG: LysM peptidoglycan-binding domain-containing protein [Carboxydocellales bacterium]